MKQCDHSFDEDGLCFECGKKEFTIRDLTLEQLCEYHSSEDKNKTFQMIKT